EEPRPDAWPSAVLGGSACGRAGRYAVRSTTDNDRDSGEREQRQPDAAARTDRPVGPAERRIAAGGEGDRAGAADGGTIVRPQRRRRCRRCGDLTAVAQVLPSEADLIGRWS